MKVHIGPYVNVWNAYNFFKWWISKTHKKEYWEVYDEDYTKLDKFIEKSCDKFQKILNITINDFLEWKGRKIKVHIDYYDVWSMDHTLALIVLPMLKKLKEVKHGSPFIENEDVPEHLHPDPNRVKMNEAGEIEEWDVDNTVHDRWSWVLDEMIHAFECELDEDWEKQFYSGNIDHNWVKDETSGFVRMENGPNHTFEVDRESMKKAMDRRKNGLRLFGKYYHGLWD